MSSSTNKIEQKIYIFLGKLHEDNIFDYYLFFDILNILVEKDVSNKEINNIKCLANDLFIYIFKSFIYHFDQSDQSKIRNFSDIESIYNDLLSLCEDFLNFVNGCGRIDYDVFLSIKEECLESIKNKLGICHIR